jgi:FkbM family methyltransferase
MLSRFARRVGYSWGKSSRQRDEMRSFTLRGLTLYLPEAALKGTLERALSSGRYENHEADALLMHLRPADRLLDLGAGLGFICALAAGVLGEGSVFGIEAGPETVKLARKNLAANGFPGVKLMRGAVVAAGEGDVEFGQRPAFWASGLKGPEGWPENAEVIRVPARPIGKLLAKLSPTVICCDIEGGELQALTQPLPGVRLVVVETHPQVYGADGVERITLALVEQGFVVEPKGAKADTLVFRRD